MAHQRSTFWLVATIIIFALVAAISMWVLISILFGGIQSLPRSGKYGAYAALSFRQIAQLRG